MQDGLRLFDDNRRPGSYLRSDLKGDVLYSSFRYGKVSLTFGALGSGVTRVQDDWTQEMLRAGIITQAEKKACNQAIQRAFDTKEKIESFDDFSMEQLHRHIQQLRRDALGDCVIARAQEMAAKKEISAAWGVDQRDQKEKLLQHASAVIFAVSEAEWLSVLRADMENAQRLGKKMYMLCGDNDTWLAEAQLRDWLQDIDVQFVSLEGDAALQAQIDRGEAALMAYGEEGLLFCRGLRMDALVQACPTGFYAQALINSLDAVRRCAVYVPAHWDVTAYAPLRERARLTYWQLWQLQKDQGKGVYACTPEELYRRYPQYFLNIYHNGAHCEEAGDTCVLPAKGNPFAALDFLREEWAKKYLDGFSNLQLEAHYFDENGCEASLPYGEEGQHGGILVHSVRVKAAKKARVISRGEDTPLRRLFDRGDTGVFSNFLFFMTPKLSALYNDLRADRPLEQADVTTGHLDYMLCHEGGRRVETFPLFEKMCIAMQESGEFLFFNFRLGGGQITAAGQSYAWRAEDVNAGGASPVQVYTPYLSCEDEDADRQQYRRMVGEGRVNLVILQDRIHCIRRGDVVLPSAGVVVSLSEEAAQGLLQRIRPLENGYFDASEVALTVRLDAPEGIEKAVWENVRWAYGGGLSLIRSGRALSDETDFVGWFAREGWMSPLSRQTQESALHTLARHPRTAIGCTKNGDMLMLVFSGRTKLSAGADYLHMCDIARKIDPQIEQLMNVDGGASAVLCMVRNGVVTELNCPSTSSGSCAGMARPIKTMLYIPAE